jgi:hypothetical protein
MEAVDLFSMLLSLYAGLKCASGQERQGTLNDKQPGRLMRDLMT